MATDPKQPVAPKQEISVIEKPVPAGNLPSLLAAGTGDKLEYYNSIRADDNTSRSRAFNAMTGNAKSLEDVIGSIILVQDVVAVPVHLPDSLTGEVRPALRVVLVQPNGVMYGCVSTGIWNSIKKAAFVFGEPTWDGGLEFKVLSAKAKVGRTFYLERPTDDEIAKFRKELADEEKKRAETRK